MARKDRRLCEYCRGWVTSPNLRRVTLEQAVTHHLAMCPGHYPGLRKPVKLIVEEPVVVPEPPRKRVIPRQVLTDD